MLAEAAIFLPVISSVGCFLSKPACPQKSPQFEAVPHCVCVCVFACVAAHERSDTSSDPWCSIFFIIFVNVRFRYFFYISGFHQIEQAYLGKQDFSSSFEIKKV